MLPIIEYSISLGNILTITTVVGSVMTFIWSMKSDILVIRGDVSHLQEGQRELVETFKQFGNVLTSGAIRDTRITMIEKRLDELAHGKGFIG